MDEMSFNLGGKPINCMVCVDCGERIFLKYNFCPHCGQKITEAQKKAEGRRQEEERIKREKFSEYMSEEFRH